MSRCDIITMPTKACSGKCMNAGCASSSRVWIVAACEGMVSLFEKTGSNAVIVKPQGEFTVFPSLEKFKHSMDEAEHKHAFDKLIIIGSSNDIAWIHSSLPEAASRHIAAEINYPLLSSWFKEPEPMAHLSKALQSVLS